VGGCRLAECCNTARCKCEGEEAQQTPTTHVDTPWVLSTGRHQVRPAMIRPALLGLPGAAPFEATPDHCGRHA
jgi:hypothetical protein